MFGKKRKYTGFDRNSKGRRAGTNRFIDWVMFLNGGKVTNLGSWMVRDMRGKAGNPSVHGTGRAVDFGYANREDGLALTDFLVRNADLLGVEMVADYWPKPWGRTWRCDRNDWKVYSSKTISGSPGGKWIHVELSPSVADNAQWFDEVFAHLLKPAEGHSPQG
jgi:hypothetical protein